jgi:NitT/TauT family transport system substrate-binding protein
VNPTTRTFLKTSAIALAAAIGLGAQAQTKLEEITYLMPAPPTLPAFAPWRIAEAKGFYAAEGLKMNWVLAKGGVDVAKQVGAGNALMGGGIGDTPLIVRANGVPVKAVAVLGGGSLMLLATRADANVKSVADLKGKTITVLSYTDTTYYALLGSMKKAGLGKSDASIQAAGPAGIWQLFAAGKAQAMAGTADWIASAEGAGAKVDIISPAQLFQSMAQAVIASDDAIKNKPETVRKVVRATLKGLQFMMDDPKGSVEAFVQAVPAFKGQEAMLERSFALSRQYVYAGQKTLGEMDRARLDAVQTYYVEEGVVAKATPLDDLYTNQFVGK